MNPLLASIQESLKTIKSSPVKPTSSTPQTVQPKELVSKQAVSNFTQPIFSAIAGGLHALTAGPVERFGSIAESIKTGSLAPLKESIRKQGEEFNKPVDLGTFKDGTKFTMKSGLLNIVMGATGHGTGAIRTAKLSAIESFAEKAALSKSVDDIAREAQRKFPGLPTQTATELGRKYLTELDPKKIVDDLKAPPVRTAERGVFERAKVTLPETYKRIEDTRYTIRPTVPSAQAAKNFIRSNPVEAEEIALREFSDQSMFIGEELVKHFDELAANARKTGDLVTEATMLDKSAAILNTVARNATEAGRISQATSMMTRLTPDGVARFASREIQRFNEKVPQGRRIPELTGAQAKELKAEWQRIQGLTDAEAKAIAVSQYMDRIAALVPSTWYQKLATVWKAGLLTGMRTTGLNIMSTGSNFAAEIAKDIPAVAVDKVASLFTGKRTMALTTRGSGSGAASGFQKGWRYLRTGYNERDVLGKFDVRKVNFGNSPFAKAVQRYEESVFRFIGSQDMPFYYAAKARSLFSQAIAQGKNLGVKGDDLKKYVDELVQDPTDDMLKYAAYDAEVATFQNTTALAKWGQALQRQPGGEFIVPFARTPAAVAMQVINYSPMGVLAELGRSVARGSLDQRLFSQAIGRSIVGTGAAWLGGELLKAGLMTLGYPSSESERKQWEIEGRIPNAVKIGDTWRSLGAFGPNGLTMIIGGYFAQGLKESGSPTDAIMQATAAVGTTLTEQSFLKGTNQLMEVLNDPAPTAVGFFGGYLGSVIPTIIADTARASDSVERRSSEDIFGRLQSRIPGVRELLEPQVDTLGRTKPTPDVLTVMLDPTRPSKESNDPVVKEFRRLWDVGYKATPTQLGNKKGYTSLSTEENTDLWKMSGRQIYKGMQNALAHPEYDKLTDEKKQKLILQFTEDAKIEARASIIFALTQGFTGEDLKQELLKHKESGLLTKDVYKKFKTYRRDAAI